MMDILQLGTIVLVLVGHVHVAYSNVDTVDGASYFASKYGLSKSESNRYERATTNVQTANAIIETANTLATLISNTKDVLLGELEKEIKQIKLETDGITKEQRDNMQVALKELNISDRNIKRTRAILETLAKDTIFRVGRLVRYLGMVKDEWTAEKIGKFLKFEAKKMSQLVNRSLDLLKQADQLYQKTQTNLINIKSKLESFQNFVQNLANSKSQAHKDRAEDMRLKVYLPCCIGTLGLGCPVCAIGLEIAINEWESALDSLNDVLAKNKEMTGTMLTALNGHLEFMEREIQLIMHWQSALIQVSEIDWEFEEAEIFGFAEIRPMVVESLNNLKIAAQNYLKKH